MIIKNWHLSKIKLNKLIKCFIFDDDESGMEATASLVARILHINRKTVNRYYNIFRQLIHKNQKDKPKYSSSEYQYFEKSRLLKFYWIRKNKILHISESQRRFNKDKDELKKNLLEMLNKFNKDYK